MLQLGFREHEKKGRVAARRRAGGPRPQLRALPAGARADAGAAVVPGAGAVLDQLISTRGMITFTALSFFLRQIIRLFPAGKKRKKKDYFRHIFYRNIFQIL